MFSVRVRHVVTGTRERVPTGCSTSPTTPNSSGRSSVLRACCRAEGPTRARKGAGRRCRIPAPQCRISALTEWADVPQFDGVDYTQLPRGQDDGLPIMKVGAWAREKYIRVWMYEHLFATGMKNKWNQRVYVDLFAGPGLSRIRRTSDILYGSPLLALTLPDRFDRYVFCEKNPA
jgi:hypothetical protein